MTASARQETEGLAGRTVPDEDSDDAQSQAAPAARDIDDSPVTASEGTLPLDVRFDVLQNPRRRAVLEYLENESESATIGTLAEHIAAQENDKPVKALTSSERKRVYICLYQSHLPKLNDAGIIDFDSDRGTLERTEAASQLMRYLELEDTEAQGTAERSTYYFGLAGIGGVAVLAGSLLLPALVNPVSLMALTAASLFALSMATVVE